MSNRVLAALALSMSLSACMQTHATMLNPKARPAVDPSQVIIYTSPDKVPGKYDEIALLDSQGDANATSNHQMLESMRAEAGKVGANGLILSSTSEPGLASQVAQQLIGTSSDRKGKAVAIWVYPPTTSTQ